MIDYYELLKKKKKKPERHRTTDCWRYINEMQGWWNSVQSGGAVKASVLKDFNAGKIDRNTALSKNRSDEGSEINKLFITRQDTGLPGWLLATFYIRYFYELFLTQSHE